MNTHLPIEKMSSAERRVAVYISSLKLYCDYEYPVHVFDKQGRYRTWTPDFRLPELGLYVEVVGIQSNKNYDFRGAIFEHNKVDIVFVHIQRADWREELWNGIVNIQNRRVIMLKNRQA
jgi:hypothetical protein